jgi:hypothetical protein
VDALPSAHLQVIPDAGHLPQEEQPSAFTRIVLDWLGPSAAPQPQVGYPPNSVRRLA